MANPPCYGLRIDSARVYTDDESGGMYALLAGRAHTFDVAGLLPRGELALLLPIDAMIGMRLVNRIRRNKNATAPNHVATLHRRITMRRQQAYGWFYDLAQQCDLKLLDYDLQFIEGSSWPLTDGSQAPVFIVHGETETGPVQVVLPADAVQEVGDYLSTPHEHYLLDRGMFAQKARQALAQTSRQTPTAAPNWWKRLWGAGKPR